MRSLYIDYVIKPRIWMPAYDFTSGRNHNSSAKLDLGLVLRLIERCIGFHLSGDIIIQIDPNWSAITKEQGLYLLSLSSCLEEKPNDRCTRFLEAAAQAAKLDPKIQIVSSSPAVVSSRQHFSWTRKRNFFLSPYRKRFNGSTISRPVEIQLDFRETRNWPQQYRFPPTMQ